MEKLTVCYFVLLLFLMFFYSFVKEQLGVFLQVPSSQKKQWDQTLGFSMGLYCFVVPNLCHETNRRNHDMLCAICAKNEERQITSAVSTLNKPIVNDDDDDDDDVIIKMMMITMTISQKKKNSNVLHGIGCFN